MYIGPYTEAQPLCRSVGLAALFVFSGKLPQSIGLAGTHIPLAYKAKYKPLTLHFFLFIVLSQRANSREKNFELQKKMTLISLLIINLWIMNKHFLRSSKKHQTSIKKRK